MVFLSHGVQPVSFETKVVHNIIYSIQLFIRARRLSGLHLAALLTALCKTRRPSLGVSGMQKGANTSSDADVHDWWRGGVMKD